MLVNKFEGRKMAQFYTFILVAISLSMITEQVLAVITVQIGGASRLGSSVKARERYHCFWNCELVGCQLTRDDDECSYDCDKVCKPRFDYLGRSDSTDPSASGPSNTEGRSESQESILKPKSANQNQEPDASGNVDLISGQTVRLHLPRNVTASNFGIWERCAQDSTTGKLVEHSFNL